MSLRSLVPLLILVPLLAMAQDTTGLSPGKVITKSVRVVPNERLVLPPGTASTCLTIRGSDITVDFNDAYIRGDKDVYHNRENFNGIGLLIDGCNNVTIKNAHIQGFRFNVKVVNSHNVRIENCDVSFSRAILMTRDGALLDTFLNLRDNNQWRNYGAGIWIEGSSNCTVEKCYGTGGLIGAALVDTNGSRVHNCDFSFNGGWGIALSHSSDNIISWNLLDFVNRVWGGGWGGDSAALAVANDCDRNYFVGNSMTHGGDGFFLSNLNDIGPINPATGFFEPKGGSDHNVIAYNDGSWSPNNAFEGTFSDGNVYLRNISSFSGYGYWLGFSNYSLLIENTINDNDRGGIAIEHGKGTRIEGNHMERNQPTAIHLWQSDQKERKPFPSTMIDIIQNTIADSVRAYDFTGSTDLVVRDNKIVRASVPGFSGSQRTATSPIADFQMTPDWERLKAIVATKPPTFKMYSEQSLPKGSQWLQPAPYAPKDYRGNLAAQRQANPGMIELYLLESGVKVTAPDWATFEDTPEDPYLVRISAKAETGEKGGDRPLVVNLVSKDGKRTQKVTGLLRTSVWTLRWYSWRGLTYDDAQNWARLWAKEPLKTEQRRELGGDWSGKSPSEGVPADHFALAATTTIKVPPGRYLFHTVSDDGIRLFVDDRQIISRWNHHGPTSDNAAVSLDAGSHAIRVEYCQEDGAAVLRLDWTKTN
jgi:parallel beta-helix repeat protein